MLSLPEDWDYSLKGLCSISKENTDAIRSTLKELQQNHYLEIEKVRGDKGHFEYNYLIYEKPHYFNILYLYFRYLLKPKYFFPHLKLPFY